MTWSVEEGDCREVMRAMQPDSVDAIVTDPPYGLEFMGRGWDYAVPGIQFWRAARRVAKPGAYMLAFGGTRTYHRLTCAIEDAGWEIHDCLTWLYGSGFPKHKSKLKPGWEPIILARKPAPRATVLNIDDCRLSVSDAEREAVQGREHVAVSRVAYHGFATDGTRTPIEYHTAGRYPANVLLDEDAAAALDEQAGVYGDGKGLREFKRNARIGYGSSSVGGPSGTDYGDTGGVSRFFYTAKASRSEREAGLDGLTPRAGGSNAKGFADDVARGLDRNRPVANHHPTVKPIALMRWLVRLITPDDGIVLDPFTGSGTTGCAAVLEGRRFIGAELDADYAAIARARIAHWSEQAQQTP